jgi:farnesyl-diphosphate farnesyltransferase
VITSSKYNELRGPLLRTVSRSFYLSLRILPSALRDPLSLGYLLARATDTIADTSEPPVDLRINALRNLATAIQNEESAEAVAHLRETFAPLQSDPAERSLIEKLPALLDWLGELAPSDRSEVRAVLAKINRGQMLDLQRFGSGGNIRALATAAELDEYTYLVAGCVGEFWTRLCCAHVQKFADRSETEMRELGVRYGQGLQLINILRDAGNDLREGRCYFPEDELRSLGLEPSDVLQEPGRVAPILTRWREKAQRGIEAGMEYACAIRNRRIRFATALPALIGARTLSLLREAAAESITRKIKVPRAEIRQMMISSALASPKTLRTKFKKLQGAAVSKPST